MSIESFTAHLPLPSRGLSPNRARAGCWREHARVVKRGRREAWYWFQRAMPAAWERCAVTIEVHYHCPRSGQGYMPRDTMNAIAAMKPMIDAMVDVGIIPDDSAKWLEWGSVKLTRIENGGAPGVRIVVTRKNAPTHGDVQQLREQGHGQRLEALDSGSKAAAA